jgi:dihydroorotate dehydrogenase
VPFEHPKYGKGGLSGGPVRVRSLELIRALRSVVYKPIIGVGGIYDSEDMLAYMEAGACACQAYCGFVRGPNSGPRFAYKVLGGD